MTTLRRVCLDARLVEGIAGGVQQAVTGLVSGLSQLTDGNEEYLVLAYANDRQWIEPFVYGACRLILAPPMPALPKWRQWLRATPLVRESIYRVSTRAGRRTVSISSSDGLIEKAGVELMHFALQTAFRTSVPSIYQPWDLQHVHLPQFFSARECMARDVRYRAFCEQARTVLVTSFWGKRDLVRALWTSRRKGPGRSLGSRHSLPTQSHWIVILNACARSSRCQKLSSFILLKPGRIRTTLGCWKQSQFCAINMGWRFRSFCRVT